MDNIIQPSNHWGLKYAKYPQKEINDKILANHAYTFDFYLMVGFKQFYIGF